MLEPMVERVFLGWDQPFLTKAVPWLLKRQDSLPEMRVMVPTAQSGRRLREALAEATGGLLAPKFVTPGSLLQSRDAEAAADWIDHVAWVEVLESVTDWSEYERLFAEPPNGGANWASGLAREMVRLRKTLQENGLLVSTAARILRDTVEAERWETLGSLEDLVERKLCSWEQQSRSRTLSEGMALPEEFSHLVLAGVTEMPPLVGRMIAAWSGRVTALIGAPETEASSFSPLGKPTSVWAERPLPWPDGSVQIVADSRQQAIEALRVVGEIKTPSAEVALGSADTETGDELARCFTREGWPAFHPAAVTTSGGLVLWFRTWCAWLADPTLAVVADLLALPETGVLVGGKRAQKARRLAEFRDRWMVTRTEDLRQRCDAEPFRNEWEKKSTEELLKATETLENWRGSFLNENSNDTTTRMLEILGRTGPTTEETARTMAAWFAEAAPLMEQVKRGPGFWIELMLLEHPSPAPLPPAGRVIDVQGWLELYHEPGLHLVLCGMNEGKVPARSGGEPWLSEASREKLGLIKDADRAARDAFLYQSMVEARRHGGRVDVICGKSGAGGESLLPSRILLAADRDDLPGRVKSLFKDVEPPEAGLRWHADWKWTPRTAEPPKRLNVTSLGDYLTCPFRYYLKHVLKMQSPEPNRTEWNARDFGTAAHEVLERWGRDPEARSKEKPEAIHTWLSSELDRVVAEWFDKRIPLAVRIQTESLRQRLLWFSRVQAEAYQEGWEVVDVERKVELPVGDALIVAKIDRIDRHRETGRLRVLDYKTGKVDGVDKAHRRKLTASSALPAHITWECPAVFTGEEKGKSAEFLWQNLQLPLYAAALVARGECLPTPCYFTLRSTEADVGIHEWVNFETADLEAARSCADWVAGQIKAGVFWPPVEKVTYDDFAVLAAGRGFEDMIAFTPLPVRAE
jgi:ATP-dependent helicase/nuclease subunit B